MTKSIPEVSAETVRLQEYLKTRSPGEIITYSSIEKETGIRMDTKGRNHLRKAAKREKIEYACHYGNGIELADGKNGYQIVRGRLIKVNRTLKRSEKTHRNIQGQFLDKMTQRDKDAMLFLGGVFGAIRLAAENGRALFSNKSTYDKLPEKIEVPVLKWGA